MHEAFFCTVCIYSKCLQNIILSLFSLFEHLPICFIYFASSFHPIPFCANCQHSFWSSQRRSTNKIPRLILGFQRSIATWTENFVLFSCSTAEMWKLKACPSSLRGLVDNADSGLKRTMYNKPWSATPAVTTSWFMSLGLWTDGVPFRVINFHYQWRRRWAARRWNIRDVYAWKDQAASQGMAAGDSEEARVLRPGTTWRAHFFIHGHCRGTQIALAFQPTAFQRLGI